MWVDCLDCQLSHCVNLLKYFNKESYVAVENVSHHVNWNIFNGLHSNIFLLGSGSFNTSYILYVLLASSDIKIFPLHFSLLRLLFLLVSYNQGFAEIKITFRFFLTLKKIYFSKYNITWNKGREKTAPGITSIKYMRWKPSSRVVPCWVAGLAPIYLVTNRFPDTAAPYGG